MFEKMEGFVFIFWLIILLISLFGIVYSILLIFQVILRKYTAITTVTLGIQDLNVRLTNIEKQNNQHKSKVSATDTSNIQQSLLKNINEVTAFENRLSRNVDEYNK